MHFIQVLRHSICWRLAVFNISVQVDSYIILPSHGILMSFKLRHFIFVFLAALCLQLGNAWAEVPTPRVKPPPPKLSTLLVKSDAKEFKSALYAAGRRRWSTFENHRNRINDPVAKDVLYWIQAMKDPNVDFSDISYVTDNLSDWPRMVGIQAKAEDKLFKKPMSTQATLAWFAGKDPVSGEGRAVLADAYYAAGDSVSGNKWLKLAWREAKLTRDGQKRIYRKHKSRLTPEDHAARADYLIWEGTSHFSKVDGLLSLMPSGERAVSTARMRLLRHSSGIDSAIAKVPQSHRTHTGLLYARGKWRRKKRSKDYALEPYLQIIDPAGSEKGMERVWRERKLMTYWAIEEGNFSEAYRLTRNHGMSRGAGFAEAEFLGGWLALRKLGKPSLAAQHFQTLRDGVTTPVSLSRGSYWLGRAHEAQNSSDARAHYLDASRFPNTFYGQLAGDKLSPGSASVDLPLEQLMPMELSSMASDRRAKAMTLLAETGEEHYYTLFSFHMDDVVETQDDLSYVARLGKQYDFMRASVRAAKQASRFQSMLTESGYPMPQAILNLPEKFDKAFVFAIARQESEFNIAAVSSARAYGMMQMINSTALATARKHRVPYSRSKLTTDVNYSANLGALHLHDLLRKYDGSYILAAAAYNAGPTRANQWIKAYGDPRTGEIDPIDWVESVPFSETRNYIQRVMENMQVYRARMNGNSAPNRIQRDLTTGAF